MIGEAVSDGRDIDVGSQPVIKIKGCKVNVDHSTVLIYCLVEYGWYVVVYKRRGKSTYAICT